MAQAVGRNSQGGSAVAEYLPVIALLLILATGLLLAAYLIFARAFIGFQMEQGLYCLAEGRPATICRRLLRDRLTHSLPWGGLNELKLRGDERQWEMTIHWQLRSVDWRLRKVLDSRVFAKRKVLRW